MPSISIITPVLNCKNLIGNCIESVIDQDNDVEHIIVDGGSTDGTLDVIDQYRSFMHRVISQKDKGIYDGMNEGVSLAKGDIVGFLNADDFYAKNTIISKILQLFDKEDIDSCYGDLVYVDKINVGKIIRYWKSGYYNTRRFYFGWMPPHPTFFVKKKYFYEYGFFNIDFTIAADYELMLRFLVKNGLTTYYIPEVLVKMRTGGVSNRKLKNLIIKTTQDYKAWKINDLKGAATAIFLKNIRKLPQFFRKTSNFKAKN